MRRRKARPTRRRWRRWRKKKSEDGTFDENELDEMAATGTDGNAQRHFTGAGGGLGDHEIGDVGASDEENKENENAESEQSAAVVLLEAGSAGGSGVEVQGD